MNSEQQWQDIKEGYLRQIEKSLAQTDHSRRAEILSNVKEHLEHRYAELPGIERNWDGYQRIITEMGPPEDYAELLTEDGTAERSRLGIDELLAIIFVLALIGIGIYLVYTAGKNPPMEPIAPASDTEMDPLVVGKWVTVDYVKTIDSFTPAKKNWQWELFLKSLTFKLDGTLLCSNTDVKKYQKRWTKGKAGIDDKRPAYYYLKTINGQTYLFYEWISGDVTIRGEAPTYYVLKKIPEGSEKTDDTAQKGTENAARIDTNFIEFSRIDKAWNEAKGQGTKVAVLDWLFDMSPAQSAKYVDAASMVKGQPVGSDEPWHGEWMAELVHQIAPEAKIIPVMCRPFSQSDRRDSDGREVYEKYLIEGIRYAADHGTVAVTNSMGPVKNCPELTAAIDYAEQKGTLFINVHPEYLDYQKQTVRADNRVIHPGLVSVPEHQTLPEQVRDIYVWPYQITPKYKDGWGYSNGPPIVGGVVALMKSAGPTLTCEQIRQIIVGTAYEKDGFRILDAEAAVKKAIEVNRRNLQAAKQE